MVRDTTEGKVNFLNVRFGPMLRRWAEHLTKGREKYPDPEPGVPNWTLATGIEELLRAQESAARHFEQWLAGDRDEDHASGIFFNVNLAEYVREQMDARALAERTGIVLSYPPITGPKVGPSVEVQLAGTVSPEVAEIIRRRASVDIISDRDPGDENDATDDPPVTVEEMFSDLSTTSESGGFCNHKSKAGWYCERPINHTGLHAAPSRYQRTPWGDDGS